MRRIRVLVVDDSALVRMALRKILSDSGKIEVVGAAANGAEAVEMARKLNPDVITLDVEMPKMDGISALGLLAKGPWKVVMLSSYTTRGAMITMKALERGAVDFVPKPAKLGDLERMSELLVAKIETANISSVPKISAKTKAFNMPPRPSLLIVGASTGGPATLVNLFSKVQQKMPWPTIIGLHMLPGFTGPFAQHLAQRTGHNTVEIKGLSELRPGTIHVVPGGKDANVIKTHQTALIEVVESSAGYSPSIDKLLETGSNCFKQGVLALIMTGMGHDGLKGAARVKETGGFVAVQDEASSVIWGMPRAIYEAELADAVLGVDDMARMLNRLASSP